MSPTRVLTTLAHHIDIDLLREAYRRTRKDGAAGVDGETGADYAENLESRLAALLELFKSGRYRAPPVRRVLIPKGEGCMRPLGIPTFEDKVLQRAVTMVLEAVYEQDFRDCSYGFRPGRSAHQALDALGEALMSVQGGWVIELDIQQFFDTLEHQHLRDILDQRMRDGVMRRAIGKWLNAGVLNEGVRERSEIGTPQGGVISPLLANIYLHEVLDGWFEDVARPRMLGRVKLVRYADDAVIVCEREDDAKRLMAVLPKRFGKYGLTLHPEKTRLMRFVRPRQGEAEPTGESFDFLGFTLHWAKSRRGKWIVRKRTAKRRLRRALVRINDWCRDHRHMRVAEQQVVLSQKLAGHYAYFGVTGNFAALARFFREVVTRWRRWLGRRSQRGYLTWKALHALLARYPLPRPRIVHSIYAAKP
jgi:group II intron reverse transcriptase/maturase